jgi:repressor LexA
MPSAELTGTQEQILKYIKSFSKKNGFPPTQKEIAECFLVYPNAARSHLLAMEKKGAIKLFPGMSRGIQCLI